jgi:predicted nucleic acid-binding protein
VTISDTSILVSCFSGNQQHGPMMRKVMASGELIVIPSLVLFEWLRGPRLPEELTAQEALFPSSLAIPFGPQEAEVSARLYKSVSRPRGREFDLAIAAYAIVRNAQLWTLNLADFKDIPGLRLASF